MAAIADPTKDVIQFDTKGWNVTTKEIWNVTPQEELTAALPKHVPATNDIQGKYPHLLTASFNKGNLHYKEKISLIQN